MAVDLNGMFGSSLAQPTCLPLHNLEDLINETICNSLTKSYCHSSVLFLKIPSSHLPPSKSNLSLPCQRSLPPMKPDSPSHMAMALSRWFMALLPTPAWVAFPSLTYSSLLPRASGSEVHTLELRSAESDAQPISIQIRQRRDCWVVCRHVAYWVGQRLRNEETKAWIQLDWMVRWLLKMLSAYLSWYLMSPLGAEAGITPFGVTPGPGAN